jgi:hypothetical protein
MAKKPNNTDQDGTPQMIAAAPTGYQLGWSGGRWVVIRGNAGSQSQTQAESQALANQLNTFVGATAKPRG